MKCPHYYEATDGVHVVIVGRCDCHGELPETQHGGKFEEWWNREWEHFHDCDEAKPHVRHVAHEAYKAALQSVDENEIAGKIYKKYVDDCYDIDKCCKTFPDWLHSRISARGNNG